MVEKTDNGTPRTVNPAPSADWSKPWVSPDFDKGFEGMEATPTPAPVDATEEITQHFEEQAPEYQQVDAIEEGIKVERKAEAQAQSQELVKSMGEHAPDSKRYNTEVAEGGSAPKQAEDGSWDVPNSMIKPRTVEIAGFDMATGEMVRNVLPNAGEHIQSALAQLRESSVNSAGQAMVNDTLPMTQLAYEFIRHDMNFEEFVAQMPDSFNREHLATAYRIADDYQMANEGMRVDNDDERSWDHGRLPEEDYLAGRGRANRVPSTAGEAPADWNLTDTDLQENEVWMNSARIMYRNLEGEEFTGTDEELHEKALQMMSLFNWSVYNMGHITRDVMNGPDDMKRAMHYMMTMYDQKDTTGDDVMNNLISLGADPFTYLSLGFGKVAIQGAQSVFKKELGAGLAKFVGAVATGGGEGAAFMTFDDFNRQMVEVEAGAKKEYDAWQTAQAAGTGAVVGAVAAPALVFGGEQLIKYGSGLNDRVKKMRANPDTAPRGPMARQMGRIGFDEPSPDEAAGKGVSAVDIIDQDVTPFKPNPNKVESPNKQVGSYLHERSRKALGERILTDNTPENREFIADVIAREVKAELLKDKSKGRAPAAQWYRDTLDNARAEVGVIHPEVVSDPRHRSAFDFAMAVTSNGQKVSDNAKYSMEVYESWKHTGRMPDTKGWGKEAGAMRKSFQMYNTLLDAWGEEKLFQKLGTEFEVRQLKDMGFNVADEAAGAKLPLSVIFGSKIGGGFFSNLQGDFTRLTPDRWFARTWGRVTGSLMDPKPELAQQHYKDFRASYVANKKTVKDYLGYAPKVSELTDELIDEMGQQIFAKWSRAKGPITKAHPKGQSFPDKSNPMHTLSRAINGRLMPKEAPAGTGERQMMRETIERVQEKLAEDGVDLNVSDIQATIWYPEQRLWDQLGSKQTGKENDYERAFRELVGQDARAAGKGRPGEASQAGAAGGLEPREAQTFTKRETLRNLRAGPRGQHSSGLPKNVFGQVGKSAESVQLGGSKVGVVKTHKPTIASANRFERINISKEPWHELEPGLASSESFRKAITASKKASGKDGAAVYVYDAADLAESKLFTTSDGKSGFAIKPDGDIVSVFNTSGRPNSAISALMLAVENGGTKLDAFDTILPHIYAQAGFKVVRREKWSNDFTPEGWDHKNFSDYNGGRPDVVYMEYDATSSGRYSLGDGSYD